MDREDCGMHWNQSKDVTLACEQDLNLGQEMKINYLSNIVANPHFLSLAGTFLLFAWILATVTQVESLLTGSCQLMMGNLLINIFGFVVKDSLNMNKSCLNKFLF